jgi:hypothetical protein
VASDSALSELKIMAVTVVGITQDVEQPRVGGNHQPSEPALSGVVECRSPGRAAVWGRDRYPAFRLIRSARVLEAFKAPWKPVEDRQARTEVSKVPERDGGGEDPEAAAAQPPDGSQSAHKSLGRYVVRRLGRDQKRPEGQRRERRRHGERIELRLRGEVNPQCVRAGSLERSPVGEPLAKVIRLPSEPDTDLDRLRTRRMRHAASLRLITVPLLKTHPPW